MTKPACYICLTGDVTVEVTDLLGFKHWFCAADWAAEQEFGERIRAMLADAAQTLEH